MTLKELSDAYEYSASLLKRRLWELRGQLACSRNPQERQYLQNRIAELTPMLTQMNEMAELTARYYEKGYWRNEKYTV